MNTSGTPRSHNKIGMGYSSDCQLIQRSNQMFDAPRRSRNVKAPGAYGSCGSDKERVSEDLGNRMRASRVPVKAWVFQLLIHRLVFAEQSHGELVFAEQPYAEFAPFRVIPDGNSSAASLFG